MLKKILLVILDGVADGEQEGKKTCLQIARKPYLDSLTSSGIGGTLDNQGEERLGLGPDSGISTWELFSYDKTDYPGRGYLDALGAGINVKPTDVCIRANFSTVKVSEPSKELIVVDRRAGREIEGLSDLAKEIRDMNIEGLWLKFYRSLGHRGALIIGSSAASPNITGSDPGLVNRPVLEIKASTSDSSAEKTAATLRKWSARVHDTLKDHKANEYRKTPANYILLRDPGVWRSLKPFHEKYGLKGAVVAASPVVKGIAGALEMDMIKVIGASGDVKTNLRDKTLAALEALNKYDFVILHILGTDAVSHDRNIDRKCGFIEKIDREVFGRIKEYMDTKKTLIAVTSDHITNIYSGVHEKGAFPFCLFTQGIKPNETRAFDEVSCKGPLGPRLHLKDFMEFLIHYRA